MSCMHVCVGVRCEVVRTPVELATINTNTCKEWGASFLIPTIVLCVNYRVNHCMIMTCFFLLAHITLQVYMLAHIHNNKHNILLAVNQ